jgi:hypothetical protein
MITNPLIGSDGRLGNQLFQYAALKGVALRCGYEAVLPPINDKSWHGQRNLLNSFNVEAREEFSRILPTHVHSEKDYMNYDASIFSIPDGSFITGYFQSTKYWKGFESQIKSELMPKSEFITEAKEYVNSLRVDARPIVSLHLRRGDNTDGSNSSTALNSMYDKGGFWETYFDKAKEKLDSPKFLVFTGGSRFTDDNSRDIQWAKDHLKGDLMFSEGGSAMQDFCRIMVCDQHVLSHISSFGWWAAYLDPKGGTVIAPKHYHPDLPEYTYREGFYPEGWILV